MSLLFAALAYQDQELTFIWGLWVVTVWTSLGAVAALVGWHVSPYSSPFRARIASKIMDSDSQSLTRRGFGAATFGPDR